MPVNNLIQNCWRLLFLSFISLLLWGGAADKSYAQGISSADVLGILNQTHQITDKLLEAELVDKEQLPPAAGLCASPTPTCVPQSTPNI